MLHSQITVKKCRECGGNVELRDGEFVCTQCGLVDEKAFNPKMVIPMGETRSPTCSLAKDDSLGTPLSNNVLFRVLNRDGNRSPRSIVCPKCGYHLNVKSGGIPINQIKNTVMTTKHPIIARMDDHGHALMDQQLNKIIGRDSNLSHVFAEMLADKINKAGKMLVYTNEKRKAKPYTKACFLLTWIKLGLPNPTALRWKLWPKTGGGPEIREVTKILNQTP